ncbi:hypothetical protein [Pseudolysinimonas kribbensis]|nr:hypothetical protein [Pseudolysinimonas kribbensis]
MAGAAGGPQAGGDRDGGAVGERVARRSTQRDAWMRVGAVAAGVALLVVGSILGSSIYRGPLLFVFLFTAAQAGALVLATVRPRTAAIAALVASAGIMVVAHGGCRPGRGRSRP